MDVLYHSWKCTTGNFIALEAFWLSHTKWSYCSSSSFSKCLALGAPLYLLISHPYTANSLKPAQLKLYGCPASLSLPFSGTNRSLPECFLLVLIQILWYFFPSLGIYSQEGGSLREKDPRAKADIPHQDFVSHCYAGAQVKLLLCKASFNPSEELRLYLLAYDRWCSYLIVQKIGKTTTSHSAKHPEHLTLQKERVLTSMLASSLAGLRL